ncbi:tannase/feruloyl esterase family alpha/beta hydrolase [Streptomyces sp. NPDC049097]|uniref:tannase/feruloyl esterase family alpha/beta hydrolase n=1 Tax=unclassified Streptomyces TaxID=2593676 RepID=UPI0033B5D231
MNSASTRRIAYGATRFAPHEHGSSSRQEEQEDDGVRTGAFMRYYVVPGANHANFGTPAFAAGSDSLSALERWVERGRPPTNPIVDDTAHNRTRPLCEYPDWPKYRAGDPDSASSFVCTH